MGGHILIFILVITLPLLGTVLAIYAAIAAFFIANQPMPQPQHITQRKI